MTRATIAVCLAGATLLAAGSAACIPENARIIFVSSTRYYPDELGEGNADIACANLARSASLPNASAFRALLLGTGENGDIMLAPEIVSDTEYVLTCGELVAPNFAALATKFLHHEINRDENGDFVSDGVWTGADSRSELDGESRMNCAHWSSRSDTLRGTIGDSLARSSDWYSITDISTGWASCAQKMRIYCVEGE